MAAESNPGGFGGKLRDARERRGISLRQIANATKISIGVLGALERNDISHLPGGIFSRAFVRSYAIEVGLEPEATIREFIAQFPGDAVTAGHPSATDIDDNVSIESNRRMASVTLRILGISLPLAGVVLYFGVVGRHVDTNRSTTTTPPTSMIQSASAATATNGSLSVQTSAGPSDDTPAPSAGAAGAIDATKASAATAGARVVVGLSAKAQCWVSVTIDGERVVYRELQQGEHEQFDMARDLFLVVGDAGAIAVTLDGADAKPFGRSGQTATLRLNLANYKEYPGSAVSAPSPLLDFFKRGEVARDVRLLAARGVLAPRAHEQLAILVVLLDDADPEIRGTAAATIDRIPEETLRRFLARPDVAPGIREFFAGRGIVPAEGVAIESDNPLIEAEPGAGSDVRAPDDDEEAAPENVALRLAKMGFPERVKAAMKGSREMRAILIRDPNKMVAVSVLSSPQVTEQEIESFSRMPNIAEDILRIIGSNRAWTKNYGVVVGLTKNPKTPVAMSLNLMSLLKTRDLTLLSIDRNVPEPLRVAARRRVASSHSGA